MVFFRTWEIYWEISYCFLWNFIYMWLCFVSKTFKALSLFFILGTLTVVYCGDFFSGHLLICALPSVWVCVFSVWGWCLLRSVEDMVYTIDLIFSSNCASKLNVWSFHCFSHLLYVLFLCLEFFIFFVHFVYILSYTLSSTPVWYSVFFFLIHSTLNDFLWVFKLSYWDS